MSDYNPTDDELRAVADNAQHASVRRDLARLVLRERVERDWWKSRCDRLVPTLADRTAERDRARAALARVEALCGERSAGALGGPLLWIRAAIAQPPAAGKDPSCAATTSTHPASGAERVSAGTAATASTSADAAIAGDPPAAASDGVQESKKQFAVDPPCECGGWPAHKVTAHGPRMQADLRAAPVNRWEFTHSIGPHPFIPYPSGEPGCFRYLDRADPKNFTRCRLPAEDPIHQEAGDG